MPRRPAKLFKGDLDKMRKAAKADEAYTAQRADADSPGLQAQARRGKVEFRYRYLSPTRHTRRAITIGEYGLLTLDQARGEAMEYRRLVATGVDPLELQEQRERESLTIRQAVDLYLKDLKDRAESGTAQRGKRSGYSSANRRLEKNVVPRLGARRAAELRPEDIRRWHRKMKDRPVEGNRTLTALSAVYGFLDRAELVPAGTNPCKHVQAHREEGRRRALTADELGRLGAALDRASRDGYVQVPREDGKLKRVAVHRSMVLAVRLLALTGMRCAEVLGHGATARRNGREGLRWADVDLDRGLVHLADSKTGRQTRVLGAAAVELLQGAKPADAQPDHCVCPGDMSKDKPFAGPGRPRSALWQVAEIEATPEGRADLHSLRHSFASLGAQLAHGRYLGAVAPLLGHGHQARSVTERYISQNPEALRPAADAISQEIARLLGLGEPARVVQHPAARRAGA